MCYTAPGKANHSGVVIGKAAGSEIPMLME